MPNVFRMMMAAAGAGGAEAFRYFRLNCSDNNGNGSFTQVGELQIMVGATAYPTVDMTGPSAPSPLVASANEDSNGVAWGAFNTVTTAPWIAIGVGGWLKIDLGSGNEIVATSVKVSAGAFDTNRQVKDFTIEGSNTGSFGGEETVLTTVTGATGWSANEEREFVF